MAAETAACRIGCRTGAPGGAPTAAAAALAERAGSNSHPSRMIPTVCSLRTTVTLVTPSPASFSASCWCRQNSPFARPSSTAIVAMSTPWRRRRSVDDARCAAGPGASVSSPTFELGHACRELGPVANAGLAEHVRDVPLDGLPRQEQLLGDLGVARAFRDQVRDHLLADGQHATTGAPPPGADPEGAQPPFGELTHRQGAALAGGQRHPCEDLLGPLPVACCEGGAEVEIGPQRVEPEAEFLRLARGRLEELGSHRLAQE